MKRFGEPRTWVRARPAQTSSSWSVPPLTAARSNAVAVTQIETHRDELLGPSTGAPSQSFLLRYHPVIEGEEIEILELSGGRAAVEWSDLSAGIHASNGLLNDLRFEYDAATGKVSAVWVRWLPISDFTNALPGDRVYTIDRMLGRIVFGNGQRGMIPPPAQNSVCARLYQVGGGSAGNVASGAISQMLNQIPAVQAVTNPESTRGGADAETLELVPPIPVTAQGLVSSSGPAPSPPPARGKSNPISQFLAKHSAGTAFDRAAITPADYERIAFDSSAGILAVVCLRAGEVPDGLSSPGKILRLIVVALDDNPSADPASGLKLSTALENTAQKAIGKCRTAWVLGRVEMTGPTPIPVDVTATVVPTPLDPNPGALPARRLIRLHFVLPRRLRSGRFSIRDLAARTTSAGWRERRVPSLSLNSRERSRAFPASAASRQSSSTRQAPPPATASRSHPASCPSPITSPFRYRRPTPWVRRSRPRRKDGCTHDAATS